MEIYQKEFLEWIISPGVVRVEIYKKTDGSATLGSRFTGMIETYQRLYHEYAIAYA